MTTQSPRAAKRVAAVLLGAGVLAVVTFVATRALSQRTERRAAPAAFAAAARAPNDGRVVRLDVDGMTCAGCAKTVAETLRKVDGVTACRVDFASQTAEVRLASADVSTATLVAAVHDVGYDATIEPESEPSARP
jgi:copper chaperone CopZ